MIAYAPLVGELDQQVRTPVAQTLEIRCGQWSDAQGGLFEKIESKSTQARKPAKRHGITRLDTLGGNIVG